MGKIMKEVYGVHAEQTRMEMWADKLGIACSYSMHCDKYRYVKLCDPQWARGPEYAGGKRIVYFTDNRADWWDVIAVYDLKEKCWLGPNLIEPKKPYNPS